jgi:hypothetical protein
MPRKYSKELIDSLDIVDNTLGTQLAKICIEANLPAIYLAKVLKVSRMTIHSWFRGSPIRHKNSKLIESFIKTLETDLEQGKLPAKNILQAKEYLKEINN